MSDLAIDGGSPVRSAPFPKWPVHDETELAALREVLESGVWSTSSGPKVREFERRFATFQGSAYGVATTSGTISLMVALRALGIGAGDEVIIPAYTFMATASAVLEVNALPIFVDIALDTYCINPDAVEQAITPRTKAIIGVHLGGHPADMDRLNKIRQRHGIPIIEDAAQAHGAAWAGRKVGAIGDIGCWSFQASKNLTSGEGGMITTNDRELAEICESLHDFGRSPGGPWYEHNLLSGNHRLTEFQSALLLAQMERLPEQSARREASAGYLNSELRHIEGIKPLRRDPQADAHAHHLYIFRYDEASFGGITRDRFVQALNAEGIPASIGYPVPLNQQPLFKHRAFDTHATGYDPKYGPTQYEKLSLPVCEQACRETVWLPQNVLLGTEEDLADIVRAVRKICNAVSLKA